ncbi:YopT-type cysteine protease domain-containing protein [Pelagibaculum spongiae]|uniref:Peptidase C58 YopT-type domain-containing protein n=1 Tax=Pelagibaculum spongiae TaxID=2080658 RepID=A0A2V1GNM2_9GAMM|nr:YopT-type cysteine protease domain-containing protein [Pelagibaculum spongiae]PVZ63443.1 hypothetical protein DC094_21280 [Pelagibaculum spongiae]
MVTKADKFREISARHNGYSVAFSQRKNYGYFRGGGGLTRVAEKLFNNDAKEGYCFGLSLYFLECSNDIDQFTNLYVSNVGRGKIRGYQKSQAVTRTSNITHHTLAAMLLQPNYSQVYEKKVSTAEELLSALKTPDASSYLISLASKGSSHAITCSAMPDGNCVYFDPNYGMISLRDRNELVQMVSEMIGELNIQKSYKHFIVSAYSPKNTGH